MLINNIVRKTLGLKRHSVKKPERKMVSCWYTWSQISAIGSFVLSAAQKGVGTIRSRNGDGSTYLCGGFPSC